MCDNPGSRNGCPEVLTFTYASVLLEGILAVRLLATGIARRLPWFTLYLFLLFSRDIATLQAAPRNSRLYEQVWAWSGIALLVLQSAAVFELYARVRREVPNFGKWSRRFYIFICGTALALAVSLVWIDVRRPLTKSLTQAAYTLAQRNVGVALAIIALLSVVIFYPFRIAMRRNIVFHGYLLALYLGANALIFGAMNLELVRRRSAGFAILTTAVVCYAAWIVALTRGGEEEPPRPEPLSSKEREELARRERALLDVERLTQRPTQEARRRSGENP